MRKFKKAVVSSLILALVLAWAGPLMAEDMAKINLNTATKEELMSLQGIGDSIADRILEYRQNHGPFQSAEELLQVKGIGDKVFEQIKDRITVQSAMKQAE